MQLKYASQFVQANESGRIKKPLIILIGGYAGTGKSTLAANLASQLKPIQVIPTGVLRSVVQTNHTERESPALFLSTYDMHELATNADYTVEGGYRNQCEYISPTVLAVIDFMSVEKQGLILEGNHIVPWMDYGHDGCNIVELYLYVPDDIDHRAMLSGPTHQRVFSDEQFRTARTIHDFLVDSASHAKKPLFAYNETMQITQHIDSRIKDFIDEAKHE